MKDIEAIVIAVIEGILDTDVKDENARLVDLGCDSLDFVDIFQEIWEKTGVDVDEEKLTSQMTVLDVINEVNKVES